MTRIDVIAIVALLIVPTAAAEPPGWCVGCLDASFGSGGLAVAPFDLGGGLGDRANALARIPGTGKIVVVGQVDTATPGESEFGIAQLLPNGQPDPSFGNLAAPGMTAFGSGVPGSAAAWDAVVLSDGSPVPEPRILIVGQNRDAGTSNIDMLIMQLDTDGTLDLGAGSNGRFGIAYDLGGDLTDRLTAVAAFADRRTAVAAGTIDTSATSDDWALYRIEAGMNIFFNSYERISFATTATLEDVATHEDGKAVAVGSRDQHGDAEMVVARYDSGGALDPDFGTSGLVYIDIDLAGAGDDRAYGVAVDRFERTIVVGTIATANGPAVFATRLTFGGAIDNAFGSNGFLWLNQPGCEATEGREVAIDPVDHIVVTYEVACGGNRDFGVFRLDPDGQWLNQSWDTSFDLVSGGDDRPRGVLVQPDGRILIAGRVQGTDGDLEFGLARLHTDLVFADDFESEGWWGADWSW
jgi:uncharacterized delta-60 repeat protein